LLIGVLTTCLKMKRRY